MDRHDSTWVEAGPFQGRGTAAAPPGRPLLRGLLLSALVGLLLGPQPSRGNPNLPLDRPFTLRNAEPFLLEKEHHRQLSGTSRLFFTFPRPCRSPADSSRVCGDGGLWRYRDTAQHRHLAFSPVAGYGYRYHGEDVHAFEGGLLASGTGGALSLDLDMRTYTELHEERSHESYDRETVERQSEEASRTVAYSSYSRYRSGMSYDWGWGRITVGRDAAHWGPGLYANLVFHQDAVPFNQVALTGRWGPLSVTSLYGRLVVAAERTASLSPASRSVYAHRYEWSAGNRLLGASEQMVLYDQEEPFAFAPIVPLFIMKGDGWERFNNGNIAFDLAYRAPRLGAIYTEFLVDDVQSPTAIFDDTWSNKWAWMAGLHAIRGIAGWETGLIAEYSRIEPWVYTHYLPGTAQSANAGFPLGNPAGPNSMSVILKSYARREGGLYAGLGSRWDWKGTDRGSSLADSSEPEPPRRKVFLGGSPSAPRWTLEATCAYRWAWAGAEASAALSSSPRLAGRIFCLR
jgi:hypothetical protein